MDSNDSSEPRHELSAEEYQEAAELFEAVVDLAPEEQRQRIAASDSSPRILAEVRSLLGQEAWTGLHEARLGELGQAMLDASSSVRPVSVGPYRILDLLGEGGMGAVYLAEQSEPIKRRVALKLIRSGQDSAGVVSRFRSEQRALARMNHDAIAKVYDAGTSESGQPFFVMELVEGERLTEFCDSRHFGIRKRLELFQQICQGVEHAHQKGVLHRDLKPGNILVADVDGEPAAKIIDFGVARATDPDAKPGSTLTEVGHILGTPAYMSPEQASGDVDSMDTRSDVYSLGVVLYELLSGQLPFDTTELRRAGVAESLRKLHATAPPRPSTRVSAVASATRDDSASSTRSSERVRRQLRGDLDWVVLQALAREPERRYASAENLRADLQRYLQGQPVLAGPPSAAYRTRKFIQRNRAVVFGSALLLLAMLIGGVSTLIQWQRAERVAAANLDLAAAERSARDTARANARELAAKVGEFNLLATLVRYESVVSSEKPLHPAWPERIDAMNRWLDDEVDPLLAMRERVEQTLDNLRRVAEPRTAEQRERDLRADPKRFALWQRQARMLSSLRAAESTRAGAPLPVAELTAEQRALPAQQLNAFAWKRVAPSPAQRRVYGEEALGLAAARLCVERAPDTPQRFRYLSTLASALSANGLDEEAEAAATRALDAAPAEHVSAQRRVLERVRSAAQRSKDTLAGFEAEHARLSAEVERRRSWTFGKDFEAEGFLHEALSELTRKLDGLESELKPSVRTRIEWARQIEELTLQHPNAPTGWPEVRERIRTTTAYAAHPPTLADENVHGLIPLGQNPATGLFEFYHLRSAWDGRSDPRDIPIPVHDPDDGTIEVREETGIVFVLVPGGRRSFGSQGTHAGRPYFDRERSKNFEQMFEADLQPYFLARHELTRAQWERLWPDGELQRDPSYYKTGQLSQRNRKITAAHPVENVDWRMCNRLLRAHGLRLPSETQWEHGCRAGTTTPFYSSRDELYRYANVADAAVKGATPWQHEAWLDGHIIHAPVGSLLPNAFGLHDIHGNVWEWCEDVFGPYGAPVAPDPESTRMRVLRGGSYRQVAVDARSANRSSQLPTLLDRSVGVRAARSLSPRD